MYIYKISDNTNNNCYIGQTKDIKKRLRQHTDKCSKKTSCQKIIDNGDWNFKIIEECEDKIANEREQYWIDNTDNVINMRPVIRKISKKDYNRQDSFKRNRWIRSWGDPRYHNCIAKIDASLFI